MPSAALIITDTVAKAPFPKNRFRATRLDPVVRQNGGVLPRAESYRSVNNFIAQGKSTTSNNSFGAKVEHHLTDKDNLTVSAFWAPNTAWDPVVNARLPAPIFGLRNNTFDMLTYIGISGPSDLPYFWISHFLLAKNQQPALAQQRGSRLGGRRRFRMRHQHRSRAASAI